MVEAIINGRFVEGNYHRTVNRESIEIEAEPDGRIVKVYNREIIEE